MDNEQKTPKATELRYVDRPDLTETFADAINSVIFDGQSMRIELGVTRLDDMKGFKGRRYPAARLVLSPAAAIDLINRMQHTAAALAQAGVVRVAQPASASEQVAGIN